MTVVFCKDSTCIYHNSDDVCIRKDVQIVIDYNSHNDPICVCDDYCRREEKENE